MGISTFVSGAAVFCSAALNRSVNRRSMTAFPMTSSSSCCLKIGISSVRYTSSSSVHSISSTMRKTIENTQVEPFLLNIALKPQQSRCWIRCYIGCRQCQLWASNNLLMGLRPSHQTESTSLAKHQRYALLSCTITLSILLRFPISPFIVLIKPQILPDNTRCLHYLAQ